MRVRIRSRLGMVPSDFRRQDVPDNVKDWPLIKEMDGNEEESCKK